MPRLKLDVDSSRAAERFSLQRQEQCIHFVLVEILLSPSKL